EPLAVDAATVSRGDGVIDGRRSGRAGDRGFAAACPGPMAIALRPSGSECRCACLPNEYSSDYRQRAAVWDDSGAASVAEQAVAGDEKRTSRFNAAAPIYSAGPVAWRANCDLHVARDGLADRRPRHGAHVARSTGLPAARRDAGRRGP